MTPQERDLITHLLDRLKQAGGQPKDAEAEGLIRQALAEQPDAPYYLVQTVLIQDMALANAQNRLTELERQVAQAKPAQPTSFLGSLLGRGAAPAAAASVPQAGPWSRPSAPPQAQPMVGQPMMGQPMMPQAMPMMASGGGGFLRSAAATAAGVAGGALLFQGIESLFGQHAGGILSGTPMQPGLSETVINNYYGGGTGADRQQTALDQPGGSDPKASDNTADAGQDDQSGYADDDVASDQDFGGSDFGSDDLA